MFLKQAVFVALVLVGSFAFSQESDPFSDYPVEDKQYYVEKWKLMNSKIQQELGNITKSIAASHRSDKQCDAAIARGRNVMAAAQRTENVVGYRQGAALVANSINRQRLNVTTRAKLYGRKLKVEDMAERHIENDPIYLAPIDIDKMLKDRVGSGLNVKIMNIMNETDMIVRITEKSSDGLTVKLTGFQTANKKEGKLFDLRTAVLVICDKENDRWVIRRGSKESPFSHYQSIADRQQED